jgi:hypothetical protein
MNQDDFTKLFKYIEEFRFEINHKIDGKASQDSIDRLTGTIDSFVKRLDDNEIEQASRDLQFNRLLE